MNPNQRQKPPRISEHLLSWLLSDDLQTPLGDFEEYFHELSTRQGLREARLWYRVQVLKLLPIRLYEKTLWSIVMLKNYFRSAYRNLYKNPFFSSLNVFGLAIGIVGCLLILLYIAHENSYDNMHENGDRIYRINWDYNWNETEGISPGTPPPLAQFLVNNLPEIEEVTRIYNVPDRVVQRGAVYFNETAIFAADSTFFDVFSFDLMQGDPKTALVQPGSVILTERTARKYFGTSEAVGQTVQIGKKQQAWHGTDNDAFIVTGVLRDIPANSHVQFDILTSINSHSIVEHFDWSWIWMQVTTYALLKESADVTQIEQRLASLVANVVPASFERVGFSYEDLITSGGRWDFVFQPLSNVYLGSTSIGNRLGPSGNNTYLQILIIVALFILTLACINFMNLSTARSVRRAKEVGVRKTLGSLRKDLVGQFMLETFMLSSVSVGIAVGITALLIKPFKSFAGISTEANLFAWDEFPIIIIGVLVVVSLFAGSYPSLYLSRFAPIDVLKKNSSSGKGGFSFRNTLVVFQFAVSIALIVCTLLANKQVEYVNNVDMGFERDGILVISNQGNRLDTQASVFVEEIERVTNVVRVAQTTGIPFASYFQDYYKAEGRGDEQYDLISYMVDDDFISTLELELVAGSQFSAEFPSTQKGIILNQSAVERFGYDNPIGKSITYPGSGTYEVIGVVKDFNFMTLHEAIMPFALFHQESNLYQISNSYIIARLQLENIRASVQSIERIWEEIAPGVPFEYSFLDERIEAQYTSEKNLTTLFFVFSALAILIACLGLFGLAAYTAEQRTREIGIRKTLGASVPSLIVLMVKDFVKWVAIASVIAWPIAWFGIKWWLDSFAYRVPIGYGNFIVAALAALVIALCTVAYHASKVAISSPVYSLRHD